MSFQNGSVGNTRPPPGPSVGGTLEEGGGQRVGHEHPPGAWVKWALIPINGQTCLSWKVIFSNRGRALWF